MKPRHARRTVRNRGAHCAAEVTGPAGAQTWSSR
jgi:hypothetical protein